LALRQEVKGQNIAVTAVLPGAIYTRPDVVDYIKTQGVWGKIAAKNPAYVVQKSLLASQKNRGKVILGFANKCMNFFTHLILPCLRMCYIAKKWSKTRKDAF
jgi:short-subunit dehydrogenase